MDSIGFVELSSIAGGIEICDAMLKAAGVDLVFAKASCPGKYYILICGNVASVETSIRTAVEMGKGFIVSSFVLPKVHKQVIQAVSMSSMPKNPKAIGVMEFFSVAPSIIAADTAVKASNVDLIDVRLGTGIGGKSFVVLTGETASVQSAVDAGTRGAVESGMLVNKIVISKPKKELIDSLF